MKTCSKCELKKELVLFVTNKYSEDGKRNYCKDCQKKHYNGYLRDNETLRKKGIVKNIRARRKRLAEWVDSLKIVPCMDCKKMWNPWQMDYDHRPGTIKIDDISGVIRCGASKKKIQEEIDKCDLICSNCHRDRTHFRKLNICH